MILTMKFVQSLRDANAQALDFDETEREQSGLR